MPLSLVHRAGVDTLGKLERAAVKRFREARRLQEAGEALGAVYLYGYSAEITLKVAYYRIIGLVPTTPIDQRLHRRPAENRISAMTPWRQGRRATISAAGRNWWSKRDRFGGLLRLP